MMVGTSNARKQRNAVVITIPAKFQIKAGQKFYIIEEDDTLRLIPLIIQRCERYSLVTE